MLPVFGAVLSIICPPITRAIVFVGTGHPVRERWVTCFDLLSPGTAEPSPCQWYRYGVAWYDGSLVRAWDVASGWGLGRNAGMSDTRRCSGFVT